jgi:hypothetical protein
MKGDGWSPRGRDRFSLSPLQIFIKPFDCSLYRVHLIFALGESMPLIRIIMRIRGFPGVLQDFHDLFRFFLGHAYIVAALKHQQRRIRIFDVGELRITFVNRTNLKRRKRNKSQAQTDKLL